MVGYFLANEVKFYRTVVDKNFNKLGMVKNFNVEVITFFKYFIANRTGSHKSVSAGFPYHLGIVIDKFPGLFILACQH